MAGQMLAEFSVGFVPKAVRDNYPTGEMNPISALHEYAQATDRKVKFVDRDMFNMPVLAAQCTCYIDDYKLTVGCGATKKDAKRNAAEKAMKLLWKHHLEERQEEEDEDFDNLAAAAPEMQFASIQENMGHDVIDNIHAVLSGSPEAEVHYNARKNVVSRIHEYYQAIPNKIFKMETDSKACSKGFRTRVFINNQEVHETFGRHSKQQSREKAAREIIKYFIPAPPKLVRCPSGNHTIYEGDDCKKCDENTQLKTMKRYFSRQSTTESGQSEGEVGSLVLPPITSAGEALTSGCSTSSSVDADFCTAAMTGLALSDPSTSSPQTRPTPSPRRSEVTTAGRSLAAQFPTIVTSARIPTAVTTAVVRPSSTTPPRMMTAGACTRNGAHTTNGASMPSIPPLRQQSSLHGRSFSQPMEISVLRERLVPEMLEEFMAPDIVSIPIKIQFRNEAAEDEDGVSREAYTAFWEEFCCAHTEGNEECVPVLYTDYSGEHWEAVGRILLKGYQDHTVFPLQLASAFIMALILGEEAVDDKTLLESYNHYLSETERDILHKAQSQEMTEDDKEEIIDFLSENGERSIPKSRADVKNLVKNIAHKKIIQEPKYILDGMAGSAREGFKLLLPMANDIREMYMKRTPTVKKVLDMIVFPEDMNKQQEACHNYLKRYIRNLDKEYLKKFLRFVTAADMICVNDIEVQFNNSSGLERRPIAHTCGPVLQLPSSYSSFLELRSEFDGIIKSGWMKMEIA